MFWGVWFCKIWFGTTFVCLVGWVLNPEHGNHDVYKCDNIKISRLKHVCICKYYILVLTWLDIVYHALVWLRWYGNGTWKPCSYSWRETRTWTFFPSWIHTGETTRAEEGKSRGPLSSVATFFLLFKKKLGTGLTHTWSNSIKVDILFFSYCSGWTLETRTSYCGK